MILADFYEFVVHLLRLDQKHVATNLEWTFFLDLLDSFNITINPYAKVFSLVRFLLQELSNSVTFFKQVQVLIVNA